MKNGRKLILNKRIKDKSLKKWKTIVNSIRMEVGILGQKCRKRVKYTNKQLSVLIRI